MAPRPAFSWSRTNYFAPPDGGDSEPSGKSVEGSKAFLEGPRLQVDSYQDNYCRVVDASGWPGTSGVLLIPGTRRGGIIENTGEARNLSVWGNAPLEGGAWAPLSLGGTRHGAAGEATKRMGRAYRAVRGVHCRAGGRRSANRHGVLRTPGLESPSESIERSR